MSIKALNRRAREARQWLGQSCLPLWAEAGLVRGQGFVAALDMNHRAPDDADLADALGHAAMADLFDLAPRVGFDIERGAEIALLARRKLTGEAPPEPTSGRSTAGQKSMAGQCAIFRAHLIAIDRDPAALGDAISAFDTLMDDFLTPEGGWIATYGADGQPDHSGIPAYLARDLARAMSPLLSLIEA